MCIGYCLHRNNGYCFSVKDIIYDSISLLRKKWTCFSQYRDDHVGEPDQRATHTATLNYQGVVAQAPFPTRACYPTRRREIEMSFQDNVERMRQGTFITPYIHYHLTKCILFVRTVQR